MTRIVYAWLLWGLVSLGALPGRATEADPDRRVSGEAVQVWHVADGLPSEAVTAVLQTEDGFLWVGTSAGLARFDGDSFTRVSPTDSSTNGLTEVTALCEDHKGYVWIGTQREGLFQLAAGHLLHYGAEKGLVSGAITCLAIDDRGQVWIGGNAGLSLWTGEQFRFFSRRDGLPDDTVSGVNVGRSGTVWITTRLGMCRFVEGKISPYPFNPDSQGRSPEYLGAFEDQRTNLWLFGDTYLINFTENKRFNWFRSSEAASLRIWSLGQARDGSLWIGTSGRGLFCFKDERIQPVLLGEQRWPYDVRAICEDREGNLWLGTSGGGLMQLRPQSAELLRVDQGFPEDAPTALAVDNAGRAYVGMQRGGVFVEESGRFERLGAGNGPAIEQAVCSLCVGRDGTLWGGTLGGGLYGWKNGQALQLTTADGLADDSVLAVCADPQGGVWASTSAGTVHHFAGPKRACFGPEQGLPDTVVTAMLPAVGGGLWLGTKDGRVFRQSEGKFTELEALRNMAGQPVVALCPGAQQRLWVGSAGGGLSCLANGAGWNWSTNDGLPADTVTGVVEDGAANLWLATSLGIYRIDHGDVARLFSRPSPLLPCKLVSTARIAPSSKTFVGGTRAVLSPDGRAWFATGQGLLKVSPRQPAVTPAVFPVYIESVAVNGQPPVSLLHAGPWSEPSRAAAPLEMPLDFRSLEIHFTALSFVAPKYIQFRHQLAGFDVDWVDDGGTRLARYGRLPHGRYALRVAARAPGGTWQEAGESFAFVVTTPFYYEPWAICLYVLAGVALVAGSVRMISHRRLRLRLVRLEQQQALERERMRIARDMHDELGSKLTKISFLSETVQVGAETPAPLAGKVQLIAQASRDVLQTMDEIVWAVNPRNDTLENLVAYLHHYAVEYFQNTSVQCEMRLPAELPQYALSSEVRHNLFLTFKEALNNVLKHSGASTVRVTISCEAHVCELSISDDGKGFQAAPPGGAGLQARGGGSADGLKNMRQRMAAIGGECLVESQPNQGTVINLRLRLAGKTTPGE